MAWVGRETGADETLRMRLTKFGSDEPDGPRDGQAPARWELQPTWRCRNFHVSRKFTTGKRGHKECVFCGASLYLTFPEDHNGPLPSHRAEPFVLNQPFGAPRIDGVPEAIARHRRRRLG